MPQFRGDVSAILLASAEALAWFATDVDSIMNSVDNGVVSAVHAKCRHLVSILAAVSSPHDEFTAAVSAVEKKFKKGTHINEVRSGCEEGVPQKIKLGRLREIYIASEYQLWTRGRKGSKNPINLRTSFV